jgi:hypothetical protein
MDGFGDEYNYGNLFKDEIFNNNPNNLALKEIKGSVSLGCLEKQKVQNLFKDYVPILKSNDVSKLVCTKFRGKKREILNQHQTGP